ncbi:MAG: TRAP transporter large permease [Chloroflexota bacterium]|nr:TRAP transporter large permease [Chloroflexota bacterium]
MILVGIGIALVVICFIVGSPIFIAFGAGSSIILLWHLGIPGSAIPRLMFESVNSYSLAAIPAFILAGNLMTYGGTSRELVRWVNTLVGHIPGGLGITVVLSCAVFAACSGSALAAAGAIGMIMIPMMTEQGYDEAFSNGLVAGAATLGPIIPPSVIMILYGALTETSIPALFYAGVFPGILYALILIGYALVISRRHKYGIVPKSSWGERGKATIRAIPALLFPVIILFGIYGGICTATEIAAIATIYSVLVGFLAYRQLNMKLLYHSLKETVLATGRIMLIVAAAMLFGRVLILLGVGEAIKGAVFGMGLSVTAFLALLVLIILIFGMFMELLAMLYILIPLIWPICGAFGIDPVFLGLLVCMGACVGYITPPFGSVVFTVSSFTGMRADSIFRHTIIPAILEAVTVYIVLFVPSIATWLPGKIFG